MPSFIAIFSRPLLLLFAILPLLAVLACNKQHAPAQEPVKSASFHSQSHDFALNGQVESGSQFWAPMGNASISISDNTAHSGLYSMYVGNRSENWHGVSYTFEPLQHNHGYKLAAWVKLAPGEPDSEVIITARFQGHEAVFRNLVSVVANSESWTLLASEFEHPDMPMDFIYFESPNPSLSFYVDDLSLTSASANTHVAQPARAQSHRRTSTEAYARFDWFEYRGADEMFETQISDDQFRNPILSGFRGEPSITRAGEDFYLVHSSNIYRPGIPIYHSRDLVNWRQTGFVLDHQPRFNFTDRQISEGIVAPTIRYHKGKFYIIATAVWSGGNFLMSADDPSGPWSNPKKIKGLRGMDLELFFDDDGRTYILHNHTPEGMQLYAGHRAIYLQEYDLKKNQLKADSRRLLINGGVDINKKPLWIQGPRLFKKDGWYYLSCAEGGNGFTASQVIFRSRSLEQSFQAGPNNPILTQRVLKQLPKHQVTAAGHADFVQLPSGAWWTVFMGSRAYDKTYTNLGREAFLLPLSWRDGWPQILELGETVPMALKRPALAAGKKITGEIPKSTSPVTGNFTLRDEFSEPTLGLQWQSIRESYEKWLSLDPQAQQLVIKASHARLNDLKTPAYISRRVQHHDYEASTQITLPLDEGLAAGLAVFQNTHHHYFLGLKKTAAGYSVFVEQATDSQPQMINAVELQTQAQNLVLGIESDTHHLNFYFSEPGKERRYIKKGADAKAISLGTAGESLGNRIGLYARIN